MFRKGFTLIELLVVISIIALIASIVLGSLNIARDKGRLAGLKSFSTQIGHMVGDQAVGIWDFSECTGSTTSDRSSFGNTGTLTNGATWSSNTYNSSGCSIGFTGSLNQYIAIPSSQSLSDYSQGRTFAVWIYPTDVSGCSGLCGIIHQPSSPTVDFTINTSAQIQFEIGGTRVYGIRPIPLNTWSFVVGTHTSGTNVSTVYVNGIKDISGTTAGAAANPNNGAVSIARFTSGSYFTGMIESVKAYSKDLTASEIAKIYAEGLKTHSFAQK